MTIKTDLLKRYICDIINGQIVDFEIDADKITDTTAIMVLGKVQKIIQNENYTDFQKVEEIVCLFEKYGIDAGVCHDF